MELLLLPALVAIGIKIVIFMRYSDSLLHNNVNLALFFLAAFLLNLTELFGYEKEYTGSTMMVILLAYYCSAIFLLHAFLNLALQFSQFSWKPRQLKIGLNLLLAIMIVNIIFNRGVIADSTLTDITITRVAGPYYWIVQTYILSSLIAGLALMIYGVSTLKSNHARQRCLVMLLSTLPPATVSFAIIATMAAGSTITSVLFMPVAISLMLGIIVYAEEKTRLFKLLTMVPYTRERKLHNKLIARLTDCLSMNDDPQSEHTLNLKQMMREFEGSVVEHAVGYYSGNQKMAAQALGVSEATVSRRARALNGKQS